MSEFLSEISESVIKNILKTCQEHLKICQEYLKLCQKYFKVCQEYLKICQEYLKTCQKYLKLCQEYLKRSQSVPTSSLPVPGFSTNHGCLTGQTGTKLDTPVTSYHKSVRIRPKMCHISPKIGQIRDILDQIISDVKIPEFIQFGANHTHIRPKCDLTLRKIAI